MPRSMSRVRGKLNSTPRRPQRAGSIPTGNEGVAAPPGAAPRTMPAGQTGMMRQYELVERVRSYDQSADEACLNRAYVFSMKAHGSQQRESGDPYFSHPVEVAGILSEKKLDTASIVKIG